MTTSAPLLENTVTDSALPRQSFVNRVFSSVASRYDVMNDVMSGGMHRLWKLAVLEKINPRPSEKFLDVAGGTGDIAFRIAGRLAKDLAPEQITVCDINPEMLEVGKKRALDKGYTTQLEWLCANAESLPLPSNMFDCYSIAFGLRNVTDRLAALKEAHRVLKVGGRFFCLEFSPYLTVQQLQKIYDAYSFKAIPFFGAKIAGDADAYRYLSESIRTFPAPPQLITLMEQAGFQHCRYETLSLGVVAIHTGLKVC
jgi:ubiquinone/menaquinone biosynthesis methyltransferase